MQLRPCLLLSRNVLSPLWEASAHQARSQRTSLGGTWLREVTLFPTRLLGGPQCLQGDLRVLHGVLPRVLPGCESSLRVCRWRGACAFGNTPQLRKTEPSHLGAGCASGPARTKREPWAFPPSHRQGPCRERSLRDTGHCREMASGHRWPRREVCGARRASLLSTLGDPQGPAWRTSQPACQTRGETGPCRGAVLKLQEKSRHLSVKTGGGEGGDLFTSL